MGKRNWVILLLLGFILISCEKDDEQSTGNILINCIDDHYVGASYNVITEYSFIQAKESGIYLDSDIRNGNLNTSKTEINNLNPGTYYITFYKTGWINVHKAVQVSAGKTSELKLSLAD
jgi:PEGA domain.